MKLRNVILLLLALLMLDGGTLSAQRPQRVRGVRTARWGVDGRGDSVLYLQLIPVNIYHRKRDLKNYERMVRAVKKVYPLALEAAKRMENLDEELAKYDKRRDRRAYTKAIEEALKEEISPVLWKMTRYEGKILLKLIDRETNHTVFGIIKDFRSGFTAGFYQTLAKLFGNDLKLEYDPDGEDEMLEQIVIYYRAGIL
ncbi:MAG: DUF4294 domain-containing protein [Alistipes sp.]|uniref:DUF4294 domain-containing protein n=1 Tax=Alistipes sp. TaxID=1872444 RepID=UPI001B731FBE|nr:DUF4294 domain-containing protein [Alistipes sp.]